MHQIVRQPLAFLLLVAICTGAAAQTDVNANCSTNAKQLVDQAWAAQPMDKSPKNINDPRKAEALYLQALKDSPRCKRALGLLASLIARDGDSQRAIQHYDMVLKHYPNDSTALQAKAGALASTNTDLPGALRIYARLLEINGPGNGSLHYQIAAAYSLMNRLDDSLDALKRAMAINPGWGNSGNAQRNSNFANLRKDARFWALVKEP